MSAIAHSLLSAVRAAGGHVTVSGGVVKVKASAPLPADLMARLRAAKSKVLAFLLNDTAPPIASSPTEYEERTALIEYGAGVPREWAEGFARLCVMPRPAAIAEARWHRLLDDAGRFIDGWARQAAVLGWDTASVFGVHPTAPAARFDCAGLVWLLNGAPIITMTAIGCTIRRGNALQTFTRRPAEPGCIPVWDLVDDKNLADLKGPSHAK